MTTTSIPALKRKAGVLAAANEAAQERRRQNQRLKIDEELTEAALLEVHSEIANEEQILAKEMHIAANDYRAALDEHIEQFRALIDAREALREKADALQKLRVKARAANLSSIPVTDSFGIRVSRDYEHRKLNIRAQTVLSRFW
ncbi:MAG: hypothetical protein H0W30_16055 [Gemmatimonadaceae bacterium]|nr:hypothetical protein [Gemmatimonadaceae bacterium]